MLYARFHESKHEKGTDPDVWINHLEDLLMYLELQGTKMEEWVVLMYIMNNNQKEYQFMIMLVEKDNKVSATNLLTLGRLRDDSRLQYDRDNIRIMQRKTTRKSTMTRRCIQDSLKVNVANAAIRVTRQPIAV
jgi:hypothetical protein